MSLLGCVYIVEAAGLYKIGCAKDLDRRLMQLRTAAPYLKVIHAIPCVAYREVEAHLHAVFSYKREAGEWFSLNDRDLDFIASIDWARFPAEIEARRNLEDLYRRIMKQVYALAPDVRGHLTASLRGL